MTTHPPVRCFGIRLPDSGTEVTQTATTPAEAVRLRCAGSKWYLRGEPRADRLGEWIATIDGGTYGPFDVVVRALPIMSEVPA